MCIGGTLSLPYLIPGYICAEGNYDVTAKLMSITLFMCGVATILQTLFGIRYDLGSFSIDVIRNSANVELSNIILAQTHFYS
jgi:xanthine/uracil permease